MIYMKEFFTFMASETGRAVRVVAGVAIIVFALLGVSDMQIMMLVIVLGLVPLLAGLFDWCFFAPFWGKPFLGDDLRKDLKKKK